MEQGDGGGMADLYGQNASRIPQEILHRGEKSEGGAEMMLKCTTTKFNGKDIKLYESSYKGKKQTFGSVREALLYSMGYGSDQAAELRYMMKKKIDEKSNEA